MSTKRKALIFLIVITVLIIVVMGSISLINANKRAEVGALLVGKTYSGKCYGRYYRCELEITFISETHCNVKELEPYGEGWCYYNNIPYILGGGINGVTLDFRERELYIPYLLRQERSLNIQAGTEEGWSQSTQLLPHQSIYNQSDSLRQEL